jgi:exopolyphosphatase/guanosine-5'-triphosphate,3'-diphosphate pyrophosphatase
MAAILRVADALDRGRGHPCKRSDVVVEDERIVITVPDAVDLTLETYGLHEKGDLFRQVFGKEIVLRSGGGGEPGVEFRR